MRKGRRMRYQPGLGGKMREIIAQSTDRLKGSPRGGRRLPEKAEAVRKTLSIMQGVYVDCLMLYPTRSTYAI